MRQGKPSLTALASEIERQAEAKHDYLAPTEQITLHPRTPNLIRLNGSGEYPLTRLADRQLAQYVDIPQDFYDRFKTEQPDLMAASVNRFLSDKKGETRLVRTLDGSARAFLSNSYRRVDHYDVMEAALPMLTSRNDLSVASLEVTDTRLYIKVVSTDLIITPKVGDDIRLGFVLSNSEVGLGALNLRAFTERLVCVNGMIRESVLRAAHLGRKTTASEAYELEGMTSDRTNLLEDAALMSRLRDGIAYVLSQAHADKRLAEIHKAQGVMVPAIQAPQVVEVIGRRLLLTGEERKGLLGNLIEGGNLSAWGLANAVTALGEIAGDYDRATELELAGGKVLDLGPGDWTTVLKEADTLAQAA